jgi:hypothetical protein
MARHCIQRILPDEHSSSSDSTSIDVVWVESRLEFPKASHEPDGPGELASMSCLLVSLVHDRRTSARLALLAASLNGVRVRRQRFEGDNPGRDLASAMRDRTDDFSSAVVLLDDGPVGPEKLQGAQAVLDALRCRSRDTTGLVAAVSTQPELWGDLRGVDGFVRADVGDAASVAAKLFTALATMTAPILWTCLDPEDIRLALGSAERPSQLVDAVWLPKREQLVFASEVDEQTFRQSPAAAAFIFADQATSTRGIVLALRAIAPLEQSFVYQVAVDFRECLDTSSLLIPISMFCAADWSRAKEFTPTQCKLSPRFQ